MMLSDGIIPEMALYLLPLCPTHCLAHGLECGIAQ